MRSCYLQDARKAHTKHAKSVCKRRGKRTRKNGKRAQEREKRPPEAEKRTQKARKRAQERGKRKRAVSGRAERNNHFKKGRASFLIRQIII